MEKWHIGCSGFYYKHWRGTFYPEKLAVKNWFNYYAEHFDSLELNVTFYRFPKLDMLKNWYNKSAAHFRFSVKAPRIITHMKKFNDCDRLLGDFYDTVKQGLKEKCGCCLFQLPPAYQYTEERLERIIASLDPGMRNVLEFRHPSWWQETVFRELSARNITFCGMSHPDLPQDLIKNNSLFYYRFHGENQLYSSRYSAAQLQVFANDIKSDKAIDQAYIFFNNDIHTNAVYNAKELQGFLEADSDKK